MSYGSPPLSPSGLPPAPWPSGVPPYVPQKSWFSRNWPWFLPTVILGPILLIAMVAGCSVSVFLQMLQTSEPYKRALTLATSNEQVVSKLGAPITPKWYASGSFNDSSGIG